ncbi:carboxypeptidase regulatory-like domain-containing protein [Leucobacter viscericola]|uniref:Carboxypeptidase regulatory-like domain-containing protein n=1 Tax=Leucobacter viscericola TaxID=2714935 RepID=A0A6G7XEI8_9MICO|nr:S-layer homology domain-containing protein [Leucobacter viscericola]QIK62975.1 carboxypeptidase regulatory-like domain-containing protein [Leucobacter viscericola]
MSLPATVHEARSRWKLTAIVAVVALVLSMLSLTAGQQSIAHAEDGATRTISGVVSLPEGSSASLADVTAQATLDGAEGALEPVAVEEDGTYVISDLAPGAYRVEFKVSGDSAEVVAGQTFGATAEAPEGGLVDVADANRDDVDVTLAAVVVVADADADADAKAAASATSDEAVSEPSADETMERSRPAAELVTSADLNANLSGPLAFGTVPDDSAQPMAALSIQAPALDSKDNAAMAATAVGNRSISGKVSVAAGSLSGVHVYLENAETSVKGVRPGSDSRYLNYNSTSVPAAQRDTWNAATGVYTFKNLAPGRYRISMESWAASPVLVDQWYPKALSRDKAVAVDVRQVNASGINGTLPRGVALTGRISIPSGFDKAGAGFYAVNAKNERWALYWDRTAGTYESGAMPAGDYWLQIASYNINTGSMQFVKSGTQTKFTPAAGTTLTRNVTGVNPVSKITGKIAVTGGLPSDFERAANVYQKIDGVWFPLYYAYQNHSGTYLAVKLGPGQYSVEFTAKTGRDIAKGEWWNKKPSQAKANLITLDGAKSVSGVNGTLSTGSSGQVSPFKDVLSNHKFYNEIRWMYTSGTSTGTKVGNARYYKPKDSVSREAMAAFMFRMNAPANYKAPARSPFKDVPTNYKFYKEIAWMYTSGLSTGNKVAGGREYKPKDAVSRSAMAAFMYRQYAPAGNKKYYAYFADVNSNHKFYNEISWMKDSGISTGTRINGTAYYQPNDAVSREAMAAFLFRNALYR